MEENLFVNILVAIIVAQSDQISYTQTKFSDVVALGIRFMFKIYTSNLRAYKV